MSVLKEGTVLDERYRIVRVLGQGGFGVTYLVDNIRLDMPVALKELYPSGLCARGKNGASVDALPGQEEAFNKQKTAFLREARTIRDFAELDGVVRVLDYFETNGTAYMVMEYLRGEPLESELRFGGKQNAEAVFRRFLPLAETLGRLHAGGLVHRDISPDNIMVLPDGRMKLIDFGAARPVGAGSTEIISKSGYTPPEQLDSRATPGPAADVYAFSAVLYRCITGKAPAPALERLLLDDLQAPSGLGAEISEKAEAVLLKGLKTAPEDRYPDGAAFAEAIRGTLPKEEPAEKGKKLPVILLGCLLLLLLIAGAYLLIRYETGAERRLSRVKTETFRVSAADSVTVAEYAHFREELRAALEKAAGRNRYLMKDAGSSLTVTVPLSVFGTGSVREGLDALCASVSADGDSFTCRYELQPVWESAESSLYAGEKQTDSEAVSLPARVLCYAVRDVGRLTRGDRARLAVELKTRLDGLGVPYAFGTEQGDTGRLLVLLGEDRYCPVVAETLAAQLLYLSGEQYGDSYAFSGGSTLRRASVQDGALVLETNYSGSLASLIETLRANHEETLYLEARTAADESLVIASVPLEKVQAEDGRVRLTFETFSYDDTVAGWLPEYIAYWINNTELSETVSLAAATRLDAEGKPDLDAGPGDCSVFVTEPKLFDIRMKEVAAGLAEDGRFTVSVSGGEIIVKMDDTRVDAGAVISAFRSILETTEEFRYRTPLRLNVYDPHTGYTLLTFYFGSPAVRSFEDAEMKYGLLSYGAVFDTEADEEELKKLNDWWAGLPE